MVCDGLFKSTLSGLAWRGHVGSPSRMDMAVTDT